MTSFSVFNLNKEVQMLWPKLKNVSPGLKNGQVTLCLKIKGVFYNAFQWRELFSALFLLIFCIRLYVK